jgi:hypothetical protein
MLRPWQKCIALFRSSRNAVGLEIGIPNIRRMCAGYDQRMPKAVEVIKRYTPAPATDPAKQGTTGATSFIARDSLMAAMKDDGEVDGNSNGDARWATPYQ